jgi:hypothetical protein
MWFLWLSFLTKHNIFKIHLHFSLDLYMNEDIFHCILGPNNIPLHGYTFLSFFIHPGINICSISTFWLLCNCAMNICIHILCDIIFIFLLHRCRTGIIGSYWNFISNILRNCLTISKAIPSAMYEGSNF